MATLDIFNNGRIPEKIILIWTYKLWRVEDKWTICVTLVSLTFLWWPLWWGFTLQMLSETIFPFLHIWNFFMTLIQTNRFYQAKQPIFIWTFQLSAWKSIRQLNCRKRAFFFIRNRTQWHDRRHRSPFLNFIYLCLALMSMLVWHLF